MSHINLGRFQKTEILKKYSLFQKFCWNPSLPCILFRNRLTWLGSTYWQARIHTGFHRFTEIGQIFHNFQVARLHPKWMELSNILSECRRNTGQGTLRELNSKILQGEHTSGSPSLRLPSALVQFRKSVSIYPRSAPTWILFATRLVWPAIFLT